MTCIMVVLNGMETAAQELRPAGSVVTHVLPGGSFGDEREHPGRESPTQAPSLACKIGFRHLSTHQPLSMSVTGCTSSVINMYLDCHLKRHLVPQFNWQVTTGGNFPVWTTPWSLMAAGKNQDGFLLLFCCNPVVLSTCEVLVRRIISLLSKSMARGSVTTFVCFQRIPIEEGWESRRRRGMSLISQQRLQP